MWTAHKVLVMQGFSLAWQENFPQESLIALPSKVFLCRKLMKLHQVIIIGSLITVDHLEKLMGQSIVTTNIATAIINGNSPHIHKFLLCWGYWRQIRLPICVLYSPFLFLIMTTEPWNQSIFLLLKKNR